MSFSEEKRKKLIVPAVALMMCAVAMIGIGYAAISTSVESDSNDINHNYLYIDLSENGTFEDAPIRAETSGFFDGVITLMSVKDANGTVNVSRHSTSTTFIKVMTNINGKATCNLKVESNAEGLELAFYKVDPVPAGPISSDSFEEIESDFTTTTTSGGVTISTFEPNVIYCIIVKSITDDVAKNNFTIKFTAS